MMLKAGLRKSILTLFLMITTFNTIFVFKTALELRP